MTNFTRTSGGLVEKWRFHSLPTIWVEGPTDIIFYEPIVGSVSYRIEPFHGKENSKALIDGLKKNNYPYLIILDGDYSILSKRRSAHRNVLTLGRYSFENYLWNDESVNRSCLRSARCGDNEPLVVESMRSVIKMLNNRIVDLIALDIAAQRTKSPIDVLPHRIDALIKGKQSTDLDPKIVSSFINKSMNSVSKEYFDSAKKDVQSFIKNNCISHIIPGHLIFGILRRIFIRHADEKRGSKSTTSDNALLQILSDAVWKYCHDLDYQRLKKSLRSKSRNVAKAFSSF